MAIRISSPACRLQRGVNNGLYNGQCVLGARFRRRLMESRGPMSVLPDEPKHLRVRPEALRNYQRNVLSQSVAKLLRWSGANVAPAGKSRSKKALATFKSTQCCRQRKPSSNVPCDDQQPTTIRRVASCNHLSSAVNDQTKLVELLRLDNALPPGKESKAASACGDQIVEGGAEEQPSNRSDVPEGCEEVSEVERRSMIGAIHLAILDLYSKINRLPVRMDVAPLSREQQQLQDRIDHLEKAYDIFSKRRVFVRHVDL